MTIIVILWTIWLLSYGTYTITAKDTTRISDLRLLKESLDVFWTRKVLPFPDDAVEVRIGAIVIGYQWFAWENTLNAIEFSWNGTDPSDDSYYSYYLSKDKTWFQLLWFLEDQSNQVTSILPQAQAVDYTFRYPKVEGRELWILTNTANTPIQSIPAIESAWFLNISWTSDTYNAYYSDTEKVQWAWGVLKKTAYNYSCKRLMESGMNKWSGYYKINPEAHTSEVKVYCDMKTDGGGWTGIVTFNPKINNSYYRYVNAGTTGNEYITYNGFYNYIALANTTTGITPKEVYVSKWNIWWDGSEYLFELVWTSIYSRRGELTDLAIATWVTSLFTSPTNPSLTNWLNAYANPEALANPGGSKNNFAQSDVSATYYNFPFNDGTWPTSADPALNDDYFSDYPWWGAYYDENTQVYMFIREE